MLRKTGITPQAEYRDNAIIAVNVMPPELVLCGTLSPDIEVFMRIPEELFRNRFEQEYNAETGRDLIPEGADFGT